MKIQDNNIRGPDFAFDWTCRKERVLGLVCPTLNDLPEFVRIMKRNVDMNYIRQCISTNVGLIYCREAWRFHKVMCNGKHLEYLNHYISVSDDLEYVYEDESARYELFVIDVCSGKRCDLTEEDELATDWYVFMW